jgi:hypothetical protein
MKFSPQQKRVFDFILAHKGTTIREIRNGTNPPVMKPDMRISEMNFARPGLITTLGTNRSREKLYAIGIQPPTPSKVEIVVVDGLPVARRVVA